MKRLFFFSLFFIMTLLLPKIVMAQEVQIPLILSPERQIPMIADVDVLVIGGTTGGVAAAATAAEHGAKTFLIAPYPYLGEDMTATLRLWLEPGETPEDPLAVAVYNDTNRGTPAPLINKESHTFIYKTEGSISSKHPENKQKPRLSDKNANDAVQNSLQIDGDVAIIADMKEPKELGEVDLVAFLRNDDFQVNEVIYSVSDDGQTWKTLGNVKLPNGRAGYDEPVSYSLTLDAPIKTRYIKAEAKRAAGTERILLAELFLVPPLKVKPIVEEPIDPNRPKFPPPRPMHVKKVLDDTLLEAGVSFIYNSYVADMLIEEGTNRVCGVVINNRQGEQVVLAKTIIDATISHNFSLRSALEDDRQRFRFGRDLSRLEYVVVGGEPQSFTDRFGLSASPQVMGTYFGKWPNEAKTESGTYKLIRYRITQTETRHFDKNFESKVQLAMYHQDQQEYADNAWYEDSSDFSQLIPKSEKERRAVIHDKTMRPINLIAQGRQLGKQFAKNAKSQPKIDIVKLRLRNKDDSANTKSDISRMTGIDVPRPKQETRTDVPTLAFSASIYKENEFFADAGRNDNYDVIVVGGGISGAPAAIAAGRQGAKVLLVEYLHGLGGVGTEGAIANYYWGNRVGFTAEVEGGKAAWVIEQRKQWWRQACVEANVQIQYGVMGIGAVVATDNPKKVIGVKTAGDGIPQYVFGKVIIDATGNGDVAAAAGAAPMYINADEIAVQGAGLPPKELGGRYRNTDYTFVDESDIFDSTHMFVYAKDKFPNAFDLAKILDTRERRRIVGDYVMTVLDQINERTYPDTIVQSRSNFDTHGYTVTPYLEIEHPNVRGFYSYSPYRMNIPRGLDGILVSGLASSCERDAVPLMRMQPDLQNQGYALGYIAATAVKDNVPLREVDIRKVQKHLVEIGNLPASVLTDIDNYEALRAELPDAVKNLPNSETFEGAYRIFWYPEEGHKLVREAFDATADKKIKTCYAQVLAVMGDPVGADLLIEKVRSYEKWDAGWNFRGMGQFGSALSPLDRLILALGRSGDKRAVLAIVEKLNLLTFADDFSHYRACSLALEELGDQSATSALAAALKKPDVSGYVHRSIDIAKKWDKADPKVDTAEKSRRDSLLEIGLARALYRLGDQDGLAKSILTDYAEHDLRGHFSRHARLVLGK